MCNIESFKIDLKALPQGKTFLEYKLDEIIKDKTRFPSFLAEVNRLCEEMLKTLKANKSALRLPENPSPVKANPKLPCPLCGKAVYKGEKNYYCSAYREGCKFSIRLEIGQKKLTEKQAEELILKGKTGLIRGFINRSGEKVDGRLLYNKETMRLGIEFKENKSEKSKKLDNPEKPEQSKK